MEIGQTVQGFGIAGLELHRIGEGLQRLARLAAGKEHLSQKMMCLGGGGMLMDGFSGGFFGGLQVALAQETSNLVQLNGKRVCSRGRVSKEGWKDLRTGPSDVRQG